MRWLSTGGAALVALWGCLSLYWELAVSQPDGWTNAQWVWVSYGVPLLLFAATLWIIFRIVWGWPQFGEFLIATEAEMNKVSWAKRSEIQQATIVVLVLVILMAGYLFAVDVVWSWFLKQIGVLRVGEAQQASLTPWGETLAAARMWLAALFC